MTLRLTLKLTNQDGGATGTLVSVDQGGVEIPLRVIVQTNRGTSEVHGSHRRRHLQRRSEGRSDLRHWAQGPATLPLVFKRPAK